MITLLICMTALISLYFLFWLFHTRNHEFWYELWHDLRIPQSSLSPSIQISSSSSAWDTWKSEICQVLCGTVLIHCREIISGHSLSMWLKCQDKAFSLLNSTAIKICYSVNVKSDFISKFSALTVMSCDSFIMSENFRVIRLLNKFRFRSLCSIETSFSWRTFSFQWVIWVKQSLLESDWSMSCTLLILHLYTTHIWCWKTSNSEFHLLDNLTDFSSIDAVNLKTNDIESKLILEVVSLLFRILMMLREFMNLNLQVQHADSETKHMSVMTILNVISIVFNFETWETLLNMLLIILFSVWIQNSETVTINTLFLNLSVCSETWLFKNLVNS